MTTEASPTLSAAQKVFKYLVWSPAIEAGLAAVGLTWWPIGALVRYATDTAFDFFCEKVDVGYIFFRNEAYHAAYEAESVKLVGVLDQYGENSEEFKRENEKAKEALNKFGRFGSR